MTHEPESEYGKKVVELLKIAYGEGNVETGVHLPLTGRFVDVVVWNKNHSSVRFAAEIENDFEDAVKGMGQGEIYGAELEVPHVVFLPPDHVDVPEVIELELADDPNIVQLPVDSVEGHE